MARRLTKEAIRKLLTKGLTGWKAGKLILQDSIESYFRRESFLTEGDNAKVGRFGYFPEWGELEGSVINPNLQRIWAGEETPEEVLPEICELVDAFLADNGYPK